MHKADMHFRIVPLEAGKPTRNPEIPKKTARLHELFRKVRANFFPRPCDTSQERDQNCSDELVHLNFFILGGFFSGGFSSSDPRSFDFCHSKCQLRTPFTTITALY